MSLTLCYDRVQHCSVTGKTEVVKEFTMRVAKTPVMPDDVEQTGEMKWQPKKISAALIVLETWRILEAA